MTDALWPEPLVPAEVCFDRDTEFPMPSELIRFGALAMEQDARVFRCVVSLMEQSWRGSPAASIRDAGARMYRLADTTKQWWRLHAEKVLSHFVRCNDGRFYHPELAQLAVKRWDSSQGGRCLDVTASEWVRLRSEVLLRDGYRCTYCGATGVKLHVDHVVALVRGGRSTTGNLVTACQPCNSSKGAKDVLEWLA